MVTRDTAWPAGTPCWVDYGAADIDAARALYTELFGWGWTGGEPEYGGYLLAQVDGRDAAGMMPQMGAGDPVAWSTYFAVDDVDAVAGRVTEAGGTVLVQPMDVGPPEIERMGRMAFAVDPQGNGFGLWQSGTTTGAKVVNVPGSLVWTDGATADLDAACAFYAAVFDWTWTDMPGMDGYRTFSLDDGRPLGGLGTARPGVPAGWTTCFATTSTDDVVALVERHGGRATMPAEDTEFGRFAVLEDPWGAAFSVMQAPPEGS